MINGVNHNVPRFVVFQVARAAHADTVQRKAGTNIPGELNSVRLSRVLTFSFAGGRIHAAALPLFDFGKVKVHLLQQLTALAAFFIVRLLGQASATRSLPSQEFCRSHHEASEYPGDRIATFIILQCNNNTPSVDDWFFDCHKRDADQVIVQNQVEHGWTGSATPLKLGMRETLYRNAQLYLCTAANPVWSAAE
jgi:hypothetical protein